MALPTTPRRRWAVPTMVGRPATVLAAALVAVAGSGPVLGGRSAARATAQPEDPNGVWYVDADAPPDGDGSPDRPFAEIQEAIDAAQAGDRVEVRAGTYEEHLETVRSGTPDAPIVLRGAPGAVIEDDGYSDRLIEITHDHVTLAGFELRHANKLVWIEGATGVRVLGNRIHDAGGEAVRLKDFANGNEIAFNVIFDTGREGFDLDDDEKNGEAIYVGTAPEQLDDEDHLDRSDRNWIHHNVLLPTAEGVEIKEGATGNVVERNFVSGSLDPEGAGLATRGNGNTFRGNWSSNNAGAGIRLGGDEDEDGIDNRVVDNFLVDNGGYGVEVARTPQAHLCGNVVLDSEEGATNEDDYEPSAPCSDEDG